MFQAKKKKKIQHQTSYKAYKQPDHAGTIILWFHAAQEVKTEEMRKESMRLNYDTNKMNKLCAQKKRAMKSLNT